MLLRRGPGGLFPNTLRRATLFTSTDMQPVIKIATSLEEIERCYPVLAELRPHLSADRFAATVERLARELQFRLVYLMDKNIKAVAGFRVGEWLHSGRYLEIEDLVTSQQERSKGYGQMLFIWLRNEAERLGCNQLRLISGVSRTDAHRFYERQGMLIEGKYFSMNIPKNGS